MSPDPELSRHSSMLSVFAMMSIAVVIAYCLVMLIFNCKFLTFVACIYVAWKLAWKLLSWQVSKFLRN